MVVYASPRRNTRRCLWEQLEILATHIIKLWLIARDFNVILHDDERKGGAVHSRPGCKLFKDEFVSTT